MAIAQRLLISMSYEASTHWTLTTIVLLGCLVGILSSYPIPSRTNATLLEKRWETLFSRSILGISGEKSDLNWESDYLLGIKRVRRLYCNVGIGFHLQVLPDGRINGVHNENQYSLIEISTVERGVVSLYGVRSELFVAMNSRGRLYGTRLLHRPQQIWPPEERQQGHDRHDCHTLPPPNMRKEIAISHLFAHTDCFPGNIICIHAYTNTNELQKKYHCI
uniref:Fibroblast growth factor n=1 Tax=Esox lucius TaxID=8010 RepID=A0AAY5L603_ESOLU